MNNQTTADLKLSKAQSCVETLDSVIGKGILNPLFLTKASSWLEVFDSIDELKDGTDKESELFRPTYLRVKDCRDRLRANPDDLYSYRQLDQIRLRLLNCDKRK